MNLKNIFLILTLCFIFERCNTHLKMQLFLFIFLKIGLKGGKKVFFIVVLGGGEPGPTYPHETRNQSYVVLGSFENGCFYLF